jgi:hypothetical protein
MGNDGLLKLACPKIREQYHLFLDCAKICDAHHMKVHFMYECLKDQIINPAGMAYMTQAQLMDARSKYIELFFQIRSGAIKLKKVSKDFRTKWKKSRKEWQKKRSHQKSAR